MLFHQFWGHFQWVKCHQFWWFFLEIFVDLLNWWHFCHTKTHQFLQTTKIFTKIGEKFTENSKENSNHQNFHKKMVKILAYMRPHWFSTKLSLILVIPLNFRQFWWQKNPKSKEIIVTRIGDIFFTQKLTNFFKSLEFSLKLVTKKTKWEGIIVARIGDIFVT